MKLILLVVFLSCLTSCGIFNYSEAIVNENQIKFENNKQFIRSIHFKGKIQSKFKLPYEIVIHCDSAVSQFDLTDFTHYKVDGRDLKILVTKDLYKNVTISDSVLKDSNTDFILIGDKKYQILSEKKNKWLPSGH